MASDHCNPSKYYSDGEIDDSEELTKSSDNMTESLKSLNHKQNKNDGFPVHLDVFEQKKERDPLHTIKQYNFDCEDWDEAADSNKKSPISSAHSSAREMNNYTQLIEPTNAPSMPISSFNDNQNINEGTLPSKYATSAIWEDRNQQESEIWDDEIEINPHHKVEAVEINNCSIQEKKYWNDEDPPSPHPKPQTSFVNNIFNPDIKSRKLEKKIDQDYENWDDEAQPSPHQKTFTSLSINIVTQNTEKQKADQDYEIWDDEIPPSPHPKPQISVAKNISSQNNIKPFTKSTTKQDYESWDDEESFTNKNAHALATRVSVSQYENWDEDISEKNKRTKKDFSEMSEREREEEIFRRMQEKESQETRLEISRSLKRQRGTEKNDDIEDWDETAPIKNQESKRLKVSDVFGEIDEYATSPRLDEQSDSEIDNIKQLDSIRLSRYRLEKWMHMPFFNDRIVGFFVRVSIGTNNNNPVYRIAQIVGVIEQDKPYTVEKQLINKRLILRICKQEKSFRMSYVSNQSFTQHEFERWVTEYRKHGEGLPRISEITEKVEDYFFCCNYVLTESDINKMVLEKQKYSHVHQNYSILKKTLINELELSKLDNNQEKIDELEIKLAEVNKVCTQLNDNHEKKMEKSMIFTEEKRLQVLNEREKLVQEEILADRNKDEDPFTRRRTLPTLIQFVNSVTLKSDVKEKILESRKNLYKTAEKEQKIDIIQQTVEKIALQPSQPDLRKLHDFELDINIDV